MVRCSLLLLLVFVSWGLGSKQPTCRKRHHHHSTPSASELSAAFHDKYKNAGSNLQKGSRLMGGEAISIEKVPHHVAILKDKDWFLAAGSIISLRAVLTAITPIESALPENMIILSGITKLLTEVENKDQVNEVSHKVFHPEWDGYLGNNLAIIFTKTNFFTNEFRRPIPVTNCEYSDLVPGADIAIVGWGAQDHSRVRSETLMHGNLTLEDNLYCYRRYKYRGFGNNKYICAGHMQQNACTEDIGGGSVRDGQLYAVMVGVHMCGLSDMPSMYMRLTDPEVRDWITTQVESVI